jgi:aminopeptidase YwaD
VAVAVATRTWQGRPRMRGRAAALLTVALLLVSGCTGSGDVATPTPSASTNRSPSDGATSSPSSSPQSSEPAQANAIDPDAAMRLVRELAALGSREATSRAFAQAADLVQIRLAALGYRVRRQTFTVPAGRSWGVQVPRGRTGNVIAVPADLAPDDPHLVVGAHLDTVPQSSGAEDNASGVAVLVELARLAHEGGTRLPVVFVAFAAEEPRGPTDDEHHFGSQEYVRRSADAEADARRGMVSLDRVGAPGRVPVWTGGLSPRRVQR